MLALALKIVIRAREVKNGARGKRTSPRFRLVENCLFSPLMHITAHQSWIGSCGSKKLPLRLGSELRKQFLAIINSGSARRRILLQQTRCAGMRGKIESWAFLAVDAWWRTGSTLLSFLEVDGDRQEALRRVSGCVD